MKYSNLYSQLLSGQEDKQKIKEETYNILYTLVYSIVKDDEETINLVNTIYERLFLNIEYISNHNLLIIYIYLITRETLHEYFHKNENKIYFIDNKLNINNIKTFESKKKYICNEIIKITNELSDEYKEPCILLSQGYSIKEIADKIGVHESTIKINLIHAEKYIRKQIQNEFKEL